MKYSSHLMGLFGSAVTENSDSQSAGLPNPNPLVGRECTAGRPREVIYNRLKKEKKRIGTRGVTRSAKHPGL